MTRIATTPGEARALLADAVAIREVRAAMLAAGGQRVWDPTPDMPALVILVDEYAELADDAPEATSDADSIARRGRAVAVTLIAATRRPTQKAMGQGALRSQMDVRICFRVRERRDVDLVLGQGMLAAGWHAHTLNAPGKFLVDEPAAVVVQRIFAEFLAGRGIYVIAERLTAEGIPCPSAHDPERNRHRCGIAWNKYAIRAILANPRYTGRQVWNRQRKDEVLIDVHDVALGHMTKMRWNDEDKWIFSAEIVHPPIIDADTFEKAQELLTARRGVRGEHKPHRSKRPYALRGLLFCGICDRRMQGHWANDAPYYRCRFPNEYALANRVRHPLNVTLRQDAVIDPLDAWLARKLAPRHRGGTIEELVAVAVEPTPHEDSTEIAARIAHCDRKLARYRATLDAGGAPAVVARWITETEAERASYQAMKPPAAHRPRMSREEIAAIVNTFAYLLAVVREADPADKAQIYAQLGLRLTYQPQNRTVLAEARLGDSPHWHFESVRGGT